MKDRHSYGNTNSDLPGVNFFLSRLLKVIFPLLHLFILSFQIENLATLQGWSIKNSYRKGQQIKARTSINILDKARNEFKSKLILRKSKKVRSGWLNSKNLTGLWQQVQIQGCRFSKCLPKYILRYYIIFLSITKSQINFLITSSDKNIVMFC